MSEDSPKNLSRDERLAAKLRENLRKRKTQSREQAADEGESTLPKATGES